jgi:diaminopimelate epimerase
LGNPHSVVFVRDAEKAPLAALGPRIVAHPLFPRKVNAEFVSVISRDKLRMRVWERGVGITLACGTGACAAAVAAVRRGMADRKVEVVLDGGSLWIEWRESDGHVIMSGASAQVYRGQVELRNFG